MFIQFYSLYYLHQSPRGKHCKKPVGAVLCNFVQENFPSRICLQRKKPRFDPWIRKIPKKGMTTHSSILAWRIPWTE